MRWKLAVLTLCVGLGAALGAASPAHAQAQGSKSAAGLNVVGSFLVEERDEGTYVRIKGSQVPTFSVFKLTSPLRLFIDVSNSELGDEPQTERVDNGVISQVALLEFKDSVQSVTRVIIGFDQAAHYDVRTEGNDVVVFVDGTRRRATPSPVARTEDVEKKVEAKYKGRLAQSRDQVQNAESQLAKTREKLAATTRELEALQAQLASSKGQERAEVRKQIASKNDVIASLKSDIGAREKKLRELNGEVARLKKERDAERRRVAELSKKAEQAMARAEKTQAERDRALELARAKEAEGQQAAERARDLEQKLASVQARLDAVSGKAEKASSTVDEHNRKLERANARVAKRTKELEAARKREAELAQQLARLRKAAEAGDENSAKAAHQLEGERARLRADLSEKQRELEQARTQAQNASTELAELRKTVESRDAEIARLRAQIENAKKVEREAHDERLAALQKAVEREKQRVAALEDARRAEERQLSSIRDAQNAERQKLEELSSKRREQQARLDAMRDQQRSGRDDRPAARAVPIDPSNTVRGIRLETREGRSRIVVELDHPGQFETLPWQDSRAVMILNDVELPEGLEKTLASDAHGGAVRFVSSYRDAQGRVRLEAELERDATEVVRQEGSQLVWEFAPRMSQPTSTAQRALDQQTRPHEGTSFTSAPPGYPRVVVDPTDVSTVPGMSRKRLTIDLREADIQNVLRLLAKEGGVNIVSGEGVSGTVTMRLRSVPLDEVFLTILQARALGFERRGNVIRVAPQETLREEQAARAEARRQATVQQPLEVFLLPINYADAGELQQQVSPLLSPRGSVSVDDRTNTLIIKDIPDNLGAVRALVQNLDAQVPQVLIEARIVETNDTFQQQLGIQWGGDLTFSQANGNPTGLLFPSVAGIAGGATDSQTPTAGTSENPNFAVNLPAPAGTGTGGALGLSLGSVGGALNINLRLSAMEQAGHAKIISAPKILTLDNQPATISQGTSIPISVVSAAGVQTVFVDATLELTVQPHVTPDGNIQLRINASKNEPDFQNTGARGDPTIIRKQAETELLIKDGDTTVIGGIYTRNAGSAISAVPFFHRIPILGFFFRTSTQSDRRTELLIFITPKIVNRAEALGSVSTGSVSGAFEQPAAGGGQQQPAQGAPQ